MLLSDLKDLSASQWILKAGMDPHFRDGETEGKNGLATCTQIGDKTSHALTKLPRSCLGSLQSGAESPMGETSARGVLWD